MPESELKALAIDLLALKAVLCALVRAQSRRSQTHLAELLDALRKETDQLASYPPDDLAHRAALSVLEAWIDDLSTTTIGI